MYRRTCNLAVNLPSANLLYRFFDRATDDLEIKITLSNSLVSYRATRSAKLRTRLGLRRFRSITAGAGVLSLLGNLRWRNDRYLQLINNDVALTVLIQGNHLGTQYIVSENNRR